MTKTIYNAHQRYIGRISYSSNEGSDGLAYDIDGRMIGNYEADENKTYKDGMPYGSGNLLESLIYSAYSEK
jgi:hypothetical protein